MSNTNNNRFKGLKNKCCGEGENNASKNPAAKSSNSVPENGNNNGNGNSNRNGNGNKTPKNNTPKPVPQLNTTKTPTTGYTPRVVVPSSTTIQPTYTSTGTRYNKPGQTQSAVQTSPTGINTSKSYYVNSKTSTTPTTTSSSGLPSYNNVIKSKTGNNLKPEEITNQKNKSNNNTSITSMNTNKPLNVNNNNNNNGKKSATNKAKNIVNKAKKKLLGETGKQILIILVVAIVTFILMYFLRKWLLNTRNSIKYTPYLIEGSKSGKSSLVISGDPNEEGSIPLYRSDGQDGAEFTYSFWMVIESMEYNYGKWKHVFHRGNKTSFPNRAPGVWLHPESNTLRVYMNTYDNPLEYVDVENVPVRKWFHCCVILNHKYLDIYFNGKLKHRKELKSAPRQNYGPFWSGLFGGFEGYLSRVRYYNKALDYNEIEKVVKAGPSKDACGDTGDYPPYLDDDWWFDTKV